MTADEILKKGCDDCPPHHGNCRGCIDKALSAVRQECADIVRGWTDSGPSEIPNTIVFFVKHGIADQIQGL